MCAAVSQSDLLNPPLPVQDPLAGIRARGKVVVEARGHGSATQLITLEECGGYRCKFPTSPEPWLDAMVVNTGGGVAGGDRLEIEVSVSGGGNLHVSTATAERIYRSLGHPTTISARLIVGARSTLVWSPQPTIAFSGSRLDRRYEIVIGPGASFLMSETICFGRRGSGERMADGLLRDRWLVRREGRLVHAEIASMAGDIGAVLDRPAVLGGANVASTLIYAAPDADDLLDKVRDVLTHFGGGIAAGCKSGLLLVRAAGTRLEQIERAFSAATEVLTSRQRVSMTGAR